MKAVLISIRPEWVVRITSGKKTLEVRKNRPKLELPFKCYIYETQGRTETPWIDEDGHTIFKGRGQVIGEFVCDRIAPIVPATEPYGTYDVDDDFVAQTGLVNGALWDYGKGATLYGWHISNLKIYDMPKPLYRFKPWNRECKYNDLGIAIPKCGTCLDCTVEKPPQSWCYVEELK
jgi:hypothetical protein|nr:MAG TPA: Protein CXorf40A-overexpressed LPS associated factor 1 [Caudoviricetes sp.]